MSTNDASSAPLSCSSFKKKNTKSCRKRRMDPGFSFKLKNHLNFKSEFLLTFFYFSLSHRSRSDLTIDSLTESQIGSVTGSESGLLGSVSSLNDTHETNDDTETEQQDDYTPVPGKIVSYYLISDIKKKILIKYKLNQIKNFEIEISKLSNLNYKFFFRFSLKMACTTSKMDTFGWKSRVFENQRTKMKNCQSHYR